MATKIKTRTKVKKEVWFTPVRGSYLPASTEGWLTYIPFVFYLIFTLVACINYTSSPVIAILFIVPNWAAASVAMTYIAYKKS